MCVSNPIFALKDRRRGRRRMRTMMMTRMRRRRRRKRRRRNPLNFCFLSSFKKGGIPEFSFATL